MVEYSYDAWGNHTIKAYNKTIANANPFRYRSYFYDTDTGLYYLKTRYYDPEVGRFLNMDAVDNADPETLGGLNLYSYCNNNPVMYSDPTGQFAISAFAIAMLIGVSVGAVVGGTISGVTAYQEGRRGWELFGSIAGGAIMGGAMGAAMVLGGAAGLVASGATVAGYGLSVGAAFSISAGIGSIGSTANYLLVNGLHQDKNITAIGVVGSFISGGFQGAATFGVGFVGGKNGLFNKLGNFKTMDQFYTNMIASTGKIKFLASLFYGTSMLFGDSLTKLIYLSSAAAGIRQIIKRLLT